MIKNLLIALALIGTAASAQTRPNPGQRPGTRPGQTKERIESAKIGFITRELQLTTDEAKAFWPIYNAMEAELKKANRDPLREGLKTVRGEGGIDNLSDAQARELLAEIDKVGAEREAVRRTYQKEFLKVLPPQKVLKLHVAERKFKQEVMERLRDAREGDRPAPPSGGRPHGGPHRSDLGSAGKPLVLINGVESDVDIDSIDPNQIASINVLKGEAAVSAYGPRATHGAICLSLRD
jgi:hypothetical protein